MSVIAVLAVLFTGIASAIAARDYRCVNLAAERIEARPMS